MVATNVSIAAADAAVRPVRADRLHQAVRVALLLFLITCVFDPVDLLLGVKVYLFLVAWVLTATHLLWRGRLPRIPRGVVVYMALFICIPLLSFSWYYGTNGGEPFEGLALLKGYLLMTLAALLVIERINLMPQLAAVLTVLSVTIIAVFGAVTVVPQLFDALYLFGRTTQIVLPDRRDYGSGLILTQIYFVTSPMLAISIAYYFDRWHTSGGFRYALLMLISMIGMILAGTRNNLAVAVLLPFVLSFFAARQHVAARLLAIVAAMFVIVLSLDYLAVLLDPNEYSNALKLALLADYGELFDDPIKLLFGQGLGAYHAWDARGGLYLFVSELTYLEVVRNFGMLGALVIFGLLAFPIVYVFSIDRSGRDKNVIVGYAFYLVMCVSNPNLFSSMGMLILAVVLANLFMTDSALAQRSVEAAA